MQPQYLSVGDLFSLPRQYVVPLFQRPYVWKESEQWQPLWEDVRRVAERELVAPASARPHFLGSVVLEQQATTSGHLDRREVIDGQQRLTTLQILLKAASDALRAAGEGPHAEILLRLTVNQTLPSSSPESRFKVWPTNVDRPRFARVIEAADPASVETRDPNDRFALAYRFFLREITAWLDEMPKERSRRAQALSTVLNRYIKLIVLDLDAHDEPQVIFETLNARGTPLLPADLVKNWLLRKAEDEKSRSPQEKPDAETLYHRHWEAFDADADYWRATIGRGHTARARIDNFLQYYLAMRLREEVAPGHLYNTFVRFADESGAENAEASLATLRRYADVFRGFDAPASGTRLAVFMQRLKTMDFVSVYPFLLDLLGRLQPGKDDLEATLQTIESFLVRRMVCQLNTRGYNTLFIDLLAHVAAGDPAASVAARVREFFSRSDADSMRWPDDADFSAAWTRNRLYTQLTRPRTVMLLRAIEEALRTPMMENIPLPEKLEVEHVMPRRWHQHWALPAEEPHGGPQTMLRDGLLHTIGNLTLVTQKLNNKLSNAPWTVPDAPGLSKRDELRKHSLLVLNREISDCAVWDEAAISARADRLFETVRTIWPGPVQGAP